MGYHWFAPLERNCETEKRASHRGCRAVLIAAFVLICPAVAVAQTGKPPEKDAVHFPGPVWPHRTPAQAGLDPERLKDAIDFAIANEVKNPRDLKLNHEIQRRARECTRGAQRLPAAAAASP
jgi:hypothetical protein